MEEGASARDAADRRRGLAAGNGAMLLWWYLHGHESTDDAQIDGHIAPARRALAGTVTAVHVEDNQRVEARAAARRARSARLRGSRSRAPRPSCAQAEAQLAAERPSVPITATTQRHPRSPTPATRSPARAPPSPPPSAISSRRGAHVQAPRPTQRAPTPTRALQLSPRRTRGAAGALRLERRRRQDRARRRRRDTRAGSRRAEERRAQREARLQQALSRAGEAHRNAPAELTIRDGEHRRAKRPRSKRAEAAVERAQARPRVHAHRRARRRHRRQAHASSSASACSRASDARASSHIDDLWVTANFKETQLAQHAPRPAATHHVDALGGRLDGARREHRRRDRRALSLLPPENATGNYVKVVQRIPVRIRLDAGQDRHSIGCARACRSSPRVRRRNDASTHRLAAAPQPVGRSR